MLRNTSKDHPIINFHLNTGTLQGMERLIIAGKICFSYRQNIRFKCSMKKQGVF